jgi:hypothetical protein
MKKLGFALLGTVALTFALLATKEGRTASPYTSQTGVAPRSAVPDLKITQVTVLGNELQLELENVSDKPIAAYAITAYDRATKREGTTHRADYAFADNEATGSIAPGQKVNFQGSFSGVETNEIVLRAVVYADGSFKGDPRAAEQVFDNRRGQSAPFVAYQQELARAITRVQDRVGNQMTHPSPDFIRTVVKPELDRVRLVARSFSASRNETSVYKGAVQAGLAMLNRELDELEQAEATQNLPALWGKILHGEERWRKFCARMQVGGEQR